MIKIRQKTGSVEKMTSSPFSQYTEGGSKVTRSVRVEDPEQYFNESGKDLLDFDAWRLGIEARLRDNADWFDTEDQRINYVMRRLAGRALRETVPFLKSSNPERFRNAEEKLDHLENQYGDPDRRRKAENDWDNLRMTYLESYGSFERRISPTLKKSLALQFLDDSVDFATIAKLAQKVDYTNSVADAATRPKRAAEKDSIFTNKDRLGASSHASNSTGQNKNLENINSPRKFPSASTPTKNHFDKAMKEGLYSTCFKPGHKFYECRKKFSLKFSVQNRDNRINNLYQKIFPENNYEPKLEPENVELENQEQKKSGNW
ncbi:hypothetical protein GcM1_237055 [Golovinomyces cichoracearum]|uniref:Uncharacterized protein n=1 Tax=Golovinomyces cichoracearum TaxID=62708 RepID=A0A420IK00_9PEZI|nr:hypothetical protein GcM1_237055 [Golovinomyces cichoracearum]